MIGNPQRDDSRGQFRTWGQAFTGAEYYRQDVVNVPSRKPKLPQRLILFGLYFLWAAVVFEMGFYVGRFYEMHP